MTTDEVSGHVVDEFSQTIDIEVLFSCTIDTMIKYNNEDATLRA